MDYKPEITKEEILKMQGIFSTSLDNLYGKIRILIEKMNQANVENDRLKESVKELNNKITDLKLQLNKINSDSIFKDKEISNLKNLLINAESSKTALHDKEFVKSRLKELISRIDVHLEQYDEQSSENDD